MEPGSESLGFLTELQSNQMLASHSNKTSTHQNSVVPIHPDEFSREIYDLDSFQYNNMNFAANLDASGTKTAVPTKKSVGVSKRCPTEDSLCYPGGNGEAILHSWSISASEEAEDQQLIDVKKQRRMLSNRESARRSRLRKQHHLDELSALVGNLRAENKQILNRFNIASEQYARITEENCLLRSQLMELSQMLQRLQHTRNAQSHGGFKTMGIETGNGNCSAAHLSFQSGAIAQSFISSDLLF